MCKGRICGQQKEEVITTGSLCIQWKKLDRHSAFISLHTFAFVSVCVSVYNFEKLADKPLNVCVPFRAKVYDPFCQSDESHVCIIFCQLLLSAREEESSRSVDVHVPVWTYILCSYNIHPSSFLVFCIHINYVLGKWHHELHDSRSRLQSWHWTHTNTHAQNITRDWFRAAGAAII